MAKFCSNCGTKLQENVRFCPKCGTPISENVAQQEIMEEAPKRNRKSFYALLAVLSAIILIICGVVYFSDSQERIEARLAREQFVKDSLEQARKDSIKLAMQIEKQKQDSIAYFNKMHVPETILNRVKEIFGNDDYFSEDYKTTYNKLLEVGEKYYPGDIVGPDYIVWDSTQGGEGERTTHFGNVQDITEKTAKIHITNVFEYEYDGTITETKTSHTLFLIYENRNWFVDDIANEYSKSLKNEMKKDTKEILKNAGHLNN